MASRTPKPPRLDRLGDALPKHAIQRLGTDRLRTSEEILAVGVSADGSVVAASTGRDVQLWNAETGAFLRTLTLPRSKQRSTIRWIRFSADGALVYVTAESFFVLDATTGGVVAAIAGCNSVCSVLDGRWVVAAWGATTKVFDLEGTELATLDADADVLECSPDGSQVAVLVSPRDAAQQVRLFDTKKWKLIRTFDGPLAPEGSLDRSALAFRVDNKRVRLHILWNDASQQTFATDTGQLRDPMPAEPPGRVRDLFEYHPNKSVVLTRDRTAIVSVQYERFDLCPVNGPFIKIAEPLHAGWLAVSADGRTLAAAEKYAVRVFDVDSGEERQIVDTHTQPLAGVAFSPGGDAVITFDAGTNARAWDVESGESLPLEHSAKLPPTTRSLLVMKRPDEETRLVDVLDARAGFKLGTRAWEAAAFADDNSVVALALRKDDSKKLAACVEVWSIPQRKKLLEVAAEVRTIALSRDGALLAGCAWEIEDLRIWKLPAGKKLRSFKSAAERSSATAVWDQLEFSPDASTLVGANGGQIAMWSVASGKRLHNWKLRKDVRKLAFTPDSAIVAAGTEEGFRLWALADGEELARVAVPAFDLRFSDDGMRLVTAGRGSALVWDVAALLGRRKRA